MYDSRLTITVLLSAGKTGILISLYHQAGTALPEIYQTYHAISLLRCTTTDMLANTIRHSLREQKLLNVTKMAELQQLSSSITGLAKPDLTHDFFQIILITSTSSRRNDLKKISAK